MSLSKKELEQLAATQTKSRKKLSEQVTDDLLRDRIAGLSFMALARKYNISYPTARRIVLTAIGNEVAR